MNKNGIPCDIESLIDELGISKADDLTQVVHNLTPVVKEPTTEVKEHVETLDELTSGWAAATKESRSYERPSLAYDINAVPFQRPEGLLDAYVRNVVSAPYIEVMLEQGFGMEPEEARAMVDSAVVLPRTGCQPLERAVRLVKFWQRCHALLVKKEGSAELIEMCSRHIDESLRVIGDIDSRREREECSREKLTEMANKSFALKPSRR